jgi:hypothetical protein
MAQFTARAFTQSGNQQADLARNCEFRLADWAHLQFYAAQHENADEGLSDQQRDHRLGRCYSHLHDVLLSLNYRPEKASNKDRTYAGNSCLLIKLKSKIEQE